MSKIDFKLVIDVTQTIVFIILLVYGYTLVGFTLSQAVLVVSNVIFGMIAVAYSALNDKD